MNVSLQTGTRLCRALDPATTRIETWTPEELASLRDDVLQLANMACELDTLKNGMPHPDRREQLARVVGEMHNAAAYFDHLHGFGIYSLSDMAIAPGEAS